MKKYVHSPSNGIGVNEGAKCWSKWWPKRYGRLFECINFRLVQRALLLLQNVPAATPCSAVPAATTTTGSRAVAVTTSACAATVSSCDYANDIDLCADCAAGW